MPCGACGPAWAACLRGVCRLPTGVQLRRPGGAVGRAARLRRPWQTRRPADRPLHGQHHHCCGGRLPLPSSHRPRGGAAGSPRVAAVV
eukprot:205350-Chlamydomonas_euryale.AAC.1